MANHSPKPDNYVRKKTWAEAMEGKPAKKQAKSAPKPKARNEAANNGGGAAA